MTRNHHMKILGAFLVLLLVVSFAISFLLNVGSKRAWFGGIFADISVTLLGSIVTIYVVDRVIKAHEENRWSAIRRSTRVGTFKFGKQVVENFQAALDDHTPIGEILEFDLSSIEGIEHYQRVSVLSAIDRMRPKRAEIVSITEDRGISLLDRLETLTEQINQFLATYSMHLDPHRWQACERISSSAEHFVRVFPILAMMEAMFRAYPEDCPELVEMRRRYGCIPSDQLGGIVDEIFNQATNLIKLPID